MIRNLLRALRRRLGAEDGIALLYALGMMVVVSGLTATALSVVAVDTSGTQTDTYQKQAYAAAQAGIQRYLFELNADNTYWTQCVPASQIANPKTEWIYNTGAGEKDPQAVPGSSTETYAVMLLPAAGQSTYKSCSSTAPTQSMIQTNGNGAGSLRIASTGIAGNAQRTIVAAIAQQNFVRYAYFTDYETSAPSVQVAQAFSATGDQDTNIEPPDQCAAQGSSAPKGCGGDYDNALTGAATHCDHWRQDGRQDQPFYNDSYGNNQQLNAYCSQIEFIDGDQINGPFHSNDSVLICGHPSFGQTGYNDKVEFGGDTSVYPLGWTSACAGSSPTINTSSGQYEAQDGSSMNMPAQNSLSTVAGVVSYTGTTCLNLLTTGIQVAQPTTSNPSCWGSTPNGDTQQLNSKLTWRTIAYPASGVVNIADSTTQACSGTYDVDEPDYFDPSTFGCGTVYVQGQDEQPLTIGADDDIVISGNLTYPTNSPGLLGLVAQNFVRLYHPVTGGVCNQTNNAQNATGSLTSPTVDAAILSIFNSFIVDDYECGNNLGELNINGAIAQKFRGVVGAGSAGYTKDYTYDRRLQYDEPPHFLAPANAPFVILHQTECDISSTCDATS